jgi:uncharacterized protein (TIGR02246 family)
MWYIWVMDRRTVALRPDAAVAARPRRRGDRTRRREFITTSRRGRLTARTNVQGEDPAKRKSDGIGSHGMMHKVALALLLIAGLNAPALAQKAEIEAVNAKWMDFFNKGDFSGIGSLYTDDATAFPPGSAMVKGKAAIEAMWKNMAEQVSDPKVTTVDVKSLGPSAAREIGTFTLKTKGPTPQEISGKYVVVWEKVGNDWKLATDIWNDGK